MITVMAKGSRTDAAAASAGFAVRSAAGGVSFDVTVVPRASRSQVVGLHASTVKIALAAPPVDGEANQALCDLLAKVLGVPKRAVQIQRGARSKHKTVEVAGVTADDVFRSLGLSGV